MSRVYGVTNFYSYSSAKMFNAQRDKCTPSTPFSLYPKGVVNMGQTCHAFLPSRTSIDSLLFHSPFGNLAGRFIIKTAKSAKQRDTFAREQR